MADESKTALEEDDGITLTLQSSDGKQFKLSRKECQLSELLKSHWADDLDEDDADEVMPIVVANGEVLGLIVRYMKHHAKHPPATIVTPLPSKDLAESVSEWDAEFISMPAGQLFHLLTASHFMLIHPLVKLICACIATGLKGVPDEKLRSFFVIENDLSPEEEIELRENNAWATDDVFPVS